MDFKGHLKYYNILKKDQQSQKKNKILLQKLCKLKNMKNLGDLIHMVLILDHVQVYQKN